MTRRPPEAQGPEEGPDDPADALWPTSRADRDGSVSVGQGDRPADWIPIVGLVMVEFPRLFSRGIAQPATGGIWHVGALLKLVERGDGTAVAYIRAPRRPRPNKAKRSEHAVQEEARQSLAATLLRLPSLPTEEQEATLLSAIGRAQAYISGVDATLYTRRRPLHDVHGPPVQGGLPSLGKKRP